MLVLAYGISINLFEGVRGKDKSKYAYPTEVEYNRVMGGLSTVTGGIAVILMLVGSNLLRRFSWRACAMITPAVLLTGVLIFFGVIYYNNIMLPEGMSIVTAMKEGIIQKELIVFAVVLDSLSTHSEKL
jgi:ATP/ADP translocase